jgi:hypothetical protein
VCCAQDEVVALKSEREAWSAEREQLLSRLAGFEVLRGWDTTELAVM